MSIQPSASPIVVKFIHRGFGPGKNVDYFKTLFPNKEPVWGNCRFVFEADCMEYDWLVVFHDLPGVDGRLAEVDLQCPAQNTMFVSLEPITITIYGKDFLRQFGHVLSFQEDWALGDHPGIIAHPPGLFWFYGQSSTGNLSYDEIAHMPLPVKTEELSTICSMRMDKTSLHGSRVAFTQWLQGKLPHLEVFGHGVKPMDDKAEALDPYKYHITVENHVAPHHITEKLPDAFLGYTLPFYHGAPNACDYFPKESFIPINFHDYERTLDIIQSTIANNEYEDRLPYIKKARQIVLEEHNQFAILAQQIEQRHDPSQKSLGGILRNRPALRKSSAMVSLRTLWEKIWIKTYLRATASSRHR